MKDYKKASLTFEELVCSYVDCRKHKSKTIQAMEFEFEREKNLFKLWDEIINHKYEVGKSICFIVTEPKYREVWAGSFRDRIVHHLIYRAIYERFVSKFIYDTYSCIVGRGTLKGAMRAAKFARNITENYTKDAYFIKMDIKNYFVSIDKAILYSLIVPYIDKDEESWLLELIEKVLFHDPRENVLFRSPKSLREKLPPYKSLFNIDKNKGLPIGNLTSQFFSNIYLNPLDQYAKHVLKCKHYLRYVDDILIIDKDPHFLNYAYSKINQFLINNLELELNHKKKNINRIERGFDFVGHVIKPNHIHLRIRTINKCQMALVSWYNNKNKFNKEELIKFQNTINSYLGMLRHTNGYQKRVEFSRYATSCLLIPDSNYTKMELV